MTTEQRSPAWTTIAVLTVGIGLGWSLRGTQTKSARAEGADRAGESVLVAGPIATGQNTKSKMQFSQDALYYLNYSTGRIFASLPIQRQTVGNTQFLSEWAERDLVEDFRLTPGTDPHFVATTGALGVMSEGWSPLYVLETTTGQVATYRVIEQVAPTSTRPAFNLIEIRRDPRLARVTR